MDLGVIKIMVVSDSEINNYADNDLSSEIADRCEKRVLKLMYDGPPRPSRASTRWKTTASEGHRATRISFQNTS